MSPKVLQRQKSPGKIFDSFIANALSTFPLDLFPLPQSMDKV